MHAVAYVRPVSPSEFGAEQTTAGRAFPESEGQACDGKRGEEEKGHRRNLDEHARQHTEKEHGRQCSSKAKTIELVFSHHLLLTNVKLSGSAFFSRSAEAIC